MKFQTFYAEKDPAPMKVSQPWRMICTDGTGPFKPHVVGGFKTKKKTLQICEVYNNFVATYLKDEGIIE